jgi:hypothetical protein
MFASRTARAVFSFLLLAAAFAVSSGPASAAVPQGPRAEGSQIAERVAVNDGSHGDRRRHRRHKHHQARHHHQREPHSVAESGSGSPRESQAPRVGSAVVAPGGSHGSGGSPVSDSGSRPAPATGGTITPPPGEQAPPGETPSSPVVEPVTTTGCFYSPSRCGYPDPTNTGVPPGTTLTPSGSIVVNQPGTTVRSVDVTGTIQILASNVTIEDSRVTQTSTCGPTSSCGNYAIAIAPGLTGVRIAQVETRTTPGATCEQDIRNTGAAVTIEATYMHACDGNIYAAGPTVLKDSYGVAKIEISADHIENIYFNETSFSAVHDTLLNPVNQTAVIFGNSGGGTDVTNCSNQLTVQESLLAGGGYSLYPCAHSSQPGSSTLNILGNHFARCLSAPTYEANGGHHPCSAGFDTNGYYPGSGSYGIATDYYVGTGIWRGNVWDDSLGKVCIDGRSSGCE